MKKKLIIFGVGDAAELAAYLFAQHTDYEPVAITLDADYITTPEFAGLPVVPFEQVEQLYAPDSHAMFVAIGYSKLNALRAEKYHAAKAKGYALASYVSPQATVFDNVKIGENCFVFENNVLQPFVQIGDNVTLWSGNHIGHHSRIGDHCFVASHAVISGRVTIGDYCFIGVNATLRDHITLGEKCVIGAGALLLHDAAAEGVYIGDETARAAVPSTQLKQI